MSDDFAEVHDELRALARSVLDKTAASASDDDSAPVVAPDWGTIAAAGWLGMEVSEQLGGGGATFAEVAVLLQEMGRALAGGPYASVVALSVPLLDVLASGRFRDDLLRDTVSGNVVPIVAVDAHGWGPSCDAVPVPFRIERTGNGAVLTGRCDLVPDAPYADYLLLPARADDATVYVAAVAVNHPGLTTTEEPVIDPTRCIGTVVAESVEVAAESLWLVDNPFRVWERLRDRVAVAVACDSLGIGEAALSRTVEYVSVRAQFGRPVGSFQAVKHACADMATQMAVARQLVEPAVRRQVEDTMEAAAEEQSQRAVRNSNDVSAANSNDASASRSAESTVAASMAKSYASSAAVDIAGNAMQLHGGVGYTWESGIHVYLKRALFNRAAFGSPAAHRERLAQRYSAQVKVTTS